MMDSKGMQMDEYKGNGDYKGPGNGDVQGVYVNDEHYVDRMAGDHNVATKYIGTPADQHDMSVLGRHQVLRRNFRFISIVGFCSTLICTWEVILALLLTNLVDGGTGGLIWGFLAVSLGFLTVYTSLAEMASMAPTAGGQYHWVSEFAPKSAQKFLSFLVGWLCFTGWQCAIVGIAFLPATIIQGLLVLNDPTYIFQRWHGTMFLIAIVSFSIFFNTFLAKKLPMIEGLVLIIHIVGLFAIIIPLWVLSPRASAHDVFLTFTNGGGWSSTGTAVMVGLSTSAFSMVGFDCGVHMSEEIKDASETLPRAITWAVVLNTCLGFILIFTLTFCLGDAAEIVKTPTGLPFIQIFFNSTKSYSATNVMCTVLIVTLVASTISEVATGSRQLWSFARDNGVPFSGWLSHVTPGWNIPLNAVIVSLIVTILLALINVGSTAAINAVVSLTICGLTSSYMVTISCVLLKRIRGQPLPPHRWSLGRWGGVINVLALCYLVPIFIFSFFPVATPVEASTMNYAVVIYGGVVVFATSYYFLYARHVYVPPVALVKRDEIYSS